MMESYSANIKNRPNFNLAKKINKNFVNHLGAWSDMNELESKHMDESQTGGLFDGENVTPWESSKIASPSFRDRNNKIAKN
jgi:hypothetical protein